MILLECVCSHMVKINTIFQVLSEIEDNKMIPFVFQTMKIILKFFSHLTSNHFPFLEISSHNKQITFIFEQFEKFYLSTLKYLQKKNQVIINNENYFGEFTSCLAKNFKLFICFSELILVERTFDSSFLFKWISSIFQFIHPKLFSYPNFQIKFFLLLSIISRDFQRLTLVLGNKITEILKIISDFPLQSSIQIENQFITSKTLPSSLIFVNSLASFVIENPSLKNNFPLENFLEKIFNLLISFQIDKKQVHSLSDTLFSLICLCPNHFELLAKETIQRYPNINFAQIFNNLLKNNNLQLTLDRKNRIIFSKNFQNFVENISNFLIIK